MRRRLAPSANVLTDTQARTLAAIIRVYARDGRATVDTVRVEAGYASKSTTHKHLVQLAVRGLVAWSDGCDGTLRPLVWPTKQSGQLASRS